MKTRRGGLFGHRSFKTKRDNKKNCQRFVSTFYDTQDKWIKKHKCDTMPSPICKEFEYSNYDQKKGEKSMSLGKYCNDDTYMNYYDFSRDGRKVKKRTEPFLDSPVPPPRELFEPWNYYPFYHHEKDTWELKP